MSENEKTNVRATAADVRKELLGSALCNNLQDILKQLNYLLAESAVAAEKHTNCTLCNRPHYDNFALRLARKDITEAVKQLNKLLS
jgi:hypothetical protein